MMVPRSFLYTSPTSASPSRQNKHKEVGLRLKTRDSLGTVAVEDTASPRKPTRISNISPSKPSKPVVIPTRTRVGVHHRIKEKTFKKGVPEENNSRHDPQLLPPAVAALLAVTSIPNSKHHSNMLTDRRNVSWLETYPQEDGGFSIHTSSKLSSQSWGALLSPPSEPEQDNCSISSDRTLDPISVRSLSSESMPSLEADMDSLCSTSNPSTPRIPTQRRYAVDRRPKTLIPSLSEECLSEHPLLLIPVGVGYEPEPDLVTGVNGVKSQPPEMPLLATTKSSFKSNLTASLRLLRSAAVSISNFTAPIIQRDDYLANPLLSISPQLTDERRPLPSTDMPNLALRRYLNPTIVSPAELYFHQHQAPSSKCTASIQMQTVYKGDRKSQNATSPPVFTSCSLSLSPEELFTTSFPRQREPRENSDFLRVIVLEMNMRKNGKLADNTPGRARLWLPPRQGLIEPKAEEARIPKRWIGVVF